MVLRIATHRGWVNIPLQLHKLFWRYYNGGWVLRSSARWKLIGDKLYLYIVFVKDTKIKSDSSRRVYAIDINENNVTIYVYPDSKATTIVTNFSKMVLGYAYRRARIKQRWSKRFGVKGNRRLKVALMKLREKNVKRDIKLKLLSISLRMV